VAARWRTSRRTAGSGTCARRAGVEESFRGPARRRSALAMAFGGLHRGIDRLSMWLEDRAPRDPQPYRAGPSGALDCFGPLPRLPPGPAAAGPWSGPSPRPLRVGDRMALIRFPALRRSEGTVLLVPPWLTASPRLVRGWTRSLARGGRDVWLVVPPHHLHRAEPGVRSGAAFVSLDMARMRATFEQLVLELRVCAALAARRGPVGLVGLSLGALASALAACAAPELDAVALVAPPADLAAVLAETPIGRRYRAVAERAGAPIPPDRELRVQLAAFDPSRLPRPAADVLVAVGSHDVIAPPEGALALARAWSAPARAYPRGHLTLLFACAAVRRDVARLVATPGAGARAAIDGRPAADARRR
jgi:dienelactone hydrolase